MTAIHCAGCQHAYAQAALFCPNCGRPRVREPAADPLLGKLLGERFLVQELLGQGGSGTIYRAEHVTLRRRVAIKVLHAELSRDDLAVERFRREATTVAEIDNEHIVEIHDFGRTPDSRLYLAMELLEGETLDAVLARDKQLSVERAADVLIQVGEALMEAHAIGYVHRDLRPRNIYLAVRRGKANFIKLLDFGLAKLVETEGQAASTSLGMTFGDPRYMSPEQARGDRIDRRADIYQLGCVAYEMLTGAPPFGGNRVFDILTKQVTEAPQPLPTRRPGVPLWMEAAVTKMLAKDPENRFATTTRMVEALRRGLETGEVMEDDVARRRESIPPPSVSRVMQRMGIPASAEAAREPAPAVPEPAAAPVPSAPVPPVAAAPSAPVPPVAAAAPSAPLRTAVPPVEPGVTMRAPIAPPPSKPQRSERSEARPDAKPDSVELLRKRTGTPRIGVPIVEAGVVLPAQSKVALPGQPPQSSVAAQAPVAGVIEPGPAAPVATAPSPAAPPAADAASNAAAADAPSALDARDAAVAVAPPTQPDDAQPRGKSQRAPASELNISQLWYDEGDQLSRDIDEPGSRSGRAPRTFSMSSADLGYYEEPPRRRWGLIAGIGAFAIIGGVMAFAMTRGRTSSAPAAVDQAVPTAAAPAPAPAPTPAEPPPSQIVASTDPAPTPAPAKPAPVTPAPATPALAETAKPAAVETAKTVEAPRSAAPAAPVAAPATRSTPAPRQVAASHPAEVRAPATRAPEPTYPVLGSGSTRRPPSLSAVPVGPADTGASRGPAASGLTDSPRDPYAGDDRPADSAGPEKKAEFYANLGSQQLGSGDTVGAAGSFQKALELNGKSVVAMMGMGEIALRQGLFGDAIAHLSKATRLVPKNVKVLTLLGEAYLSSGNSAQAAAQFKKALQLDPDNARARDGYNEASSRAAPADDEK
jgi:serine/threonine-protein kinase